MFEVRVPGVTARCRRVFAANHAEAAVIVADDLEREGRCRVGAGRELEVESRRVGWRVWYGVTLHAVDVTSYHPTEVRAIGTSKPSRR